MQYQVNVRFTEGKEIQIATLNTKSAKKYLVAYEKAIFRRIQVAYKFTNDYKLEQKGLQQNIQNSKTDQVFEILMAGNNGWKMSSQANSLLILEALV